MKHGLWLHNFISALAVVDTISKPLKIKCDNAAAIFFSKNDRYSKVAKQIDMKYLSLKEVLKKKMSIEDISTSVNIADPLTKGLPPKISVKHVDHISLGSSI